MTFLHLVMKIVWFRLVLLVISLPLISCLLSVDRGQVNKFGNVLVKVNGKVGKVCFNDWDDKDAQVVCREEGWDDGLAYLLETGNVYSLLATSFNCSGDESSLSDCPHTLIDNNTSCDQSASKYNSAAAYCFNDTQEPVFSLEHRSYGRVKVAVDGYERYLCDDIFAKQFNALLLCKELGYKNGELNAHSKPMTVTEGPGWWKGTFQCRGTEPKIAACTYNNWLSIPIQSPKDYCSYMTPEVHCYGDVRLHLPFRNSTGILGVFHDGEYRGVCADNISHQSIHTACSTLGFSEGQLETDSYNISSYNISITNVSCSGTEKSFGQCSYNFSPDTSCSERLVISCNDTNYRIEDDTENVSFHLGDFNSNHYGRVQIRRDGELRYVCDTSGYFNYEEVKLVCKQMGFISGQPYNLLKVTMNMSTQYWANDINCLTEVPTIDACVNTAWTTPDSDSTCRYSVPAIFCYGKVKLNTDFKNSSGRVNVYNEKKYDYVCATGFDSKEINVICSELGFDYGGRILPYRSFMVFYTGFGNIPLGYQCTGTEKSLMNCTHYDASPCDRPATVGCYQSPDDRVRDNWSVKVEDNGRVLVSVDGIWGTICYKQWQEKEAEVLCKSIGYTSGKAYSLDGDSYNPMLVLSVSCEGWESSLSQCSSIFLSDNSSSCDRLDTAAVVCKKPPTTTQKYIPTTTSTPSVSTSRSSLIASTNNTAWDEDHYVSVYDNAEWVAVCGYGMDDTDAGVFCRELGYGMGLWKESHEYFEELIPWLDVQCSGNETRFFDCPVNKTKSDDCAIRAQVFCYNKGDVNQYRLVGDSKPNTGSVEVYRDNKWGMLCDDNYFSSVKARLVCRTLGYIYGEKLSIFSSSRGAVWRTSLSCSNGDPVLHSCQDNGWTYFNETPPSACPFTYKVYCYGDVRLSTKYDEVNGAVYVREGQEYKTICSDGFDGVSANVTCKQLGYTSGGRLLPVAGYPSSNRLSNHSFSCKGTENSLSQCSQQTVACSDPNNIVNVACHTDSPETGNDGDVRITSDGVVQTFYYGLWGLVCGRDWGDSDADVVCREMGHIHGKAYTKYLYENNLPVWLYGVQCFGSEAELRQCQLELHRSYEPQCKYNDKAMAYCYNDTSEVVYSLDGSATNYGYFQLTRNGTTGYICDENNARENAETACRTLGFSSGELYSIDPPVSISGWWKNDITCRGVTKPSIELCVEKDWEYITSGSSLCDENNMFPSIYCYGQIRLHSRFRNSSGIVLHSSSHIYYSICSSGFNMTAANIVCKSLGFPQARTILPPTAYYSGYQIGYNSLQCPPTAVSLEDCSLKFDRNVSCSSGPAIIACDDGESTVADGLVRITDGGLVEVSKYGIWGAISFENWDDKDAEVVCKEKGFDLGKKKQRYISSHPVWMFDVNCQGTEPSILNCPHSTRQGNFYYYYAAGVLCFNSSAVNDFKLEFGYKGRLIKSTKDRTGYVCNTELSEEYVYPVVCRTLGFLSGKKQENTSRDNGSDWWGNKLVCPYDGSLLQECEKSTWQYGESFTGACSENGESVSVYCFNKVSIRSKSLVGSRGVVELDLRGNGYYQVVCGDSFTETEGRVACREAGFSGFVRLVSSDEFKSTNLPLHRFELSCSGNELSLLDCEFTNKSCSYRNYAAVECQEGRLSTTISPSTPATPDVPSTHSTVNDDENTSHGSGATTVTSGELSNPNQPAPGKNNSNDTRKATVSFWTMVIWFTIIKMLFCK